MKYSLSAVAALALGFGLAVSGAHAQGMQRNQTMMNGRHSMQSQIVRHSSHETKQAQTKLKAEGLYRGEIDGIVGPKTRRALAEFQQQNGLRRTATLDRNTLHRLMGNQTAGVGSSMPNPGMPNHTKPGHRMTNRHNGNFTNASGSGSSGQMTGPGANVPPTPPPTGATMNGAGGNNMQAPTGAGTPAAPSGNMGGTTGTTGGTTH